MTDEGGGSELGLTGRAPRTIPEPKPKNVHGPAKVIAMCNQKGGVGNTTSTINLGASLAEFGRRVLLVDLDPQGALSAGLGVQGMSWATSPSATELETHVLDWMVELLDQRF